MQGVVIGLLLAKGLKVIGDFDCTPSSTLQLINSQTEDYSAFRTCQIEILRLKIPRPHFFKMTICTLRPTQKIQKDQKNKYPECILFPR